MAKPVRMQIPCSLLRGGTSKGVYFLEQDLPPAGPFRDEVVLALFGSPDIRQIDGLGGADSLTSKAAIIGPSEVADVDFLYGMVSIDAPRVFWRGNCGNITSGVGPFAIYKGLVKPVEPVTKVRIYSRNTKTIVVAEVPVEDGLPLEYGDYRIDGVPGTGAKISLDFSLAAGSTLGKLLPTGNVRDRIHVDGIGELEYSLVDIANPEIFIRAEAVGLRGTETPAEIDSDPELLDRLERIRGTVAAACGLASSPEHAVRESANIPHLVLVSEPVTHRTFQNQTIEADMCDFVSRVMFMQRLHKAYPGTGSICSAVAAMIPGTVAHEVRRKTPIREGEICIAHPSGLIMIEVRVGRNGNEFVAERAVIGRTARLLMDGVAHVLVRPQ